MSQEDIQAQREHINKLEAELKAARAELEQVRPQAQREAWRAAGLDPDSEQAKAAARLLGDTPPTADAISELRAEFPSLFAPAAAADDVDAGQSQVPQRSEADQARVEAQQRVERSRATAEPVGAMKVPYDQYQQLSRTDPNGALQLLQTGKVDLPDYISSAIGLGHKQEQGV